MKKGMALLLALLILVPFRLIQGDVALADPSPFAEEGWVEAYPDKWAVAPKTAQAPVVDGQLDEALWQSAAPLADFRTAYFNEPAEGDIQYKLAYDDTHLYVGGTFTIEEKEALERVELVVSAAVYGSRHYVAFLPVNPTRTISADWNPVPIPDEEQQRFQITDRTTASSEDLTTGMYTVETAIPLASLGVSAVADQTEWRMNVIHIHTPNTKPLSSWMPIRTSYMSDRNGTNVSFAANVVDEARLGSVYFGETPAGAAWTPDDWTLRFTGFAEKELSFEQPTPAPAGYRLEWKGPEGGWQELTGATASLDGTRVTLAFEHPEPLTDGMYELRLIAESASPADERFASFAFDRKQLIAAGTEALGYTLPSGPGPTAVTPAPASAQVEAIMDIIPDKTGFRYVGLPEMPELAPDGLYTLSTDGKSIRSSKTGTVYPNAAYPETHELTALDRNGNPVEYPYYENGEGNRFFLSAHLWYLQNTRARTQTETVSKTDPLGAARLLYRFAQAYESYVPTTDERWYNIPMNFASGPPHNYWGGMWDRWFYNDLNNLRPLLRAFAEVKKTDALQVLSAEVGEDAERKIVDGMFLPSVDFALGYPIRLMNMDYSVWIGLIEAGKALGQPDYIHKVVEWMKVYAERRYLSDGSWYEVAPSYHAQSTTGLLIAIDALAGYSDPAGYVSPRTGNRFDDLDLYEEYPVLEKAREFANLLAYPNGKRLPLQDTWSSQDAADPDPEAGSYLMPSAGIGRLTLGEGGDQLQTYMQFVPKYGHNHFDPLNLNLFAEGQELLPDLGYTYSKYRYFTTSTIGHNTVVVDGQNMTIDNTSKHGGRIEQFVPADGPLQLMRANQQTAYPGISEYSREPWLVSFPDDAGQGYVLDLFRVSGGERHEYTLQGDANRDSYFVTDLPLTDYGSRLLPPGVEATEAEAFDESGSAEGHYPGYIYVKDVKQAELAGDRYQVEMATWENGERQGGLHITGLLEGGDDELFLARSPSIRLSRLYGEARDNNDDASLYDMPKLVHRREGTDLTSTFVTLLEPHGAGEAPRIEAIDRLSPELAPEGSVAARVTYGDTTDILISNPRHPDELLTLGDMSMRGESGFIRLRNGAVEEMRLIGGTLLKKGNAELTGSGSATGTVVDTMRKVEGDPYDALVTDAAVSANAIGGYAIVTHPDPSTHGFKIADVREADGRTVIELSDEDPGFTVNADGSSDMNYYPEKKWTGTHSLRIANRETWNGPAVPDTTPTGTVAGTVYGPNGLPFGGAEVRVSGYTSLTAESDENGHFTLASVPSGLRRLTVAEATYGTTVTPPFEALAGQSIDIAVRMDDRLPPVVSGPSTGAAGIGEPVPATSSKDGYLYLVPAATAPVRGEIEDAATGGGAVGTRAPAAAGIPSALATTGLSPGHYAVYAIDGSGNVSAGMALALVPRNVASLEDTDPLLAYTGEWQTYTAANDSGGTHTLARAEGAALEIPFYGKQAKLLGIRSANSGYADIYVDGVYQTTIDNYNPTVLYRQTLYDTGPLTPGGHVLKIVATWSKNAASSNYYVGVDSVDVTLVDGAIPVLSDATAGPVVIGDPVQAVSSKDGYLYLVPAATTAARSAIEAAGASANGTSATVTAGVYGVLGTSGFAAGQYRLYAIDTEGGVSTGSPRIFIVNPSQTTVEDTSALIDYTGQWQTYTAAQNSGGTHTLAKAEGAAAEIPFYGKRAKLLGIRSVNSGQADIYVDGVYRTTIDNYNATTLFQQTLFDTGLLAEGPHTIRIEANWTKQAAATNYYIGLDALKVLSQ